MINKIAKKLNKKGFTLVELIVVIAILAVLAAIAIPTFNGLVKDARYKALASDARSLASAAAIELSQAEVRGDASYSGGATALTTNSLKRAGMDQKYTSGAAITIDASNPWAVDTITMTKGDATVTWKKDGTISES